MRFSLIPREVRFFDLFDEITAHITGSAQKFVAMLTTFDQLEQRGAELKKEEEACDTLVEKLLSALDQAFVTPFDREDIHALATSLDDVMDSLEETAHRFAVFRIDRPTPAALQMAKLIEEACGHVAKALQLCRDMRHATEIQHHLREVGRLENEADRIYREADAALLAGNTELLSLIKWRELYAWLEETVDACRSVSNVVSEIVIKGS
jgi:predicted phosphate transport protein (TIGR00153 family)